jgi:hypothetical protein
MYVGFKMVYIQCTGYTYRVYIQCRMVALKKCLHPLARNSLIRKANVCRLVFKAFLPAGAVHSAPFVTILNFSPNWFWKCHFLFGILYIEQIPTVNDRPAHVKTDLCTWRRNGIRKLFRLLMAVKVRDAAFNCVLFRARLHAFQRITIRRISFYPAPSSQNSFRKSFPLR